jgi:Glucodextranase, domain B/PASTA domain
MRCTATLAVLAALALLSGCGGSARGRAAATAPPVQLRVSTPGDLASTPGSTVTVAGSVSPAGADVRVLGRRAEVVGGSFTARVPLQPGANVIDLFATARGRDPALTALRVTRQTPIEVPDLTHLTPDAARARLQRLGLTLRTQDGGGLLEPIMPGTPGVCTQDPRPGAHVQRGASVLALVAKRC